jgi:hypothetical protein
MVPCLSLVVHFKLVPLLNPLSAKSLQVMPIVMRYIKSWLLDNVSVAPTVREPLSEIADNLRYSNHPPAPFCAPIQAYLSYIMLLTLSSMGLSETGVFSVSTLIVI